MEGIFPVHHFKSKHIYSIKKKLQNNYETFWKINLNKCEKLKIINKIIGYSLCYSLHWEAMKGR
jgi:hypothetical protein